MYQGAATPQRSSPGKVATLHPTPPRAVGDFQPSAARVEHLPRGLWTPDLRKDASDLLGVVRAGLLVREVAIGQSASAELIGPGDVVIFGPADEHLLPSSATEWNVLQETSILWLSGPLEQVVTRSPRLAATLLRRARRRIDHLALCNSVLQLKLVEDRVLAMFWHLAERWGRVTTQGVLIEMHLTHRALARLVGAQRPTVTTALSALRRRDAVAYVESGWLLLTEPPEWWYSPEPDASPWLEMLTGLSSEATGPAAA